MNLQHEFDVPASPQATLELLLDAERVVPCMPGATLVEVAGDTWKTTMSVKLGPVGMDFLNDVRIVEQNAASGRARLAVKSRDTRGRGGAEASVDTLLVAVDGGGTHVTMDADVKFSGQAAQLGRPSVVQDISTRLVNEFAECIRTKLGSASTADVQPQAQKPVSGLSLLATAVSGALARLFRLRPGPREKGSP